MSPIDPREHARHDLDVLSESLDGRLPAEQLASVLERVAACPDCRAAYEALAWTRTQAGRLPAVDLPPGVEGQIRGRLEREAGRRARRFPARRAAGWTIAAALLVTLAALIARLAPGPPQLPQAVAEDFRSRRSLSLGLETSDPARLEAWFASSSLAFPTRVFDLRMMGYELRGGATQAAAGRASAVIVYREVATGREVICRMLRGGLADLPPPHAERERDGIPFRTYRTEGITLVFWPEADVLCVLVGDGDSEALVQLAFAKAMKARGREG